MKKVFMAALLSLTLVLLSLGSAFAQDAPFVFCGDLAEEDCALLEDSQAAMAGVTSAASLMELTLLVENVPDLPAEIGIGITLEDAFEVAPETWALVGAVNAELMNAMMGDADALLEAYGELIPGVARDLMITVDLSSEISAMLAAQGAPQIESISLSLMLVDGILYLNLDDLATVIPELGMFAGWVGLDFMELMNFAFEQALAQAEQSGDPSIVGAAIAALTIGMPSPSNGDPKALAAYGYPVEMLNDIVDVERLEDDAEAGLAVFYMSIDYEAMFADPGFQQMIMAQVAAQSGEAMSEDDMAEAGEMLDVMGPMLADAASVDLFQAVGLEDSYTYATQMHMEVDVAALAEMDEDVAAMAEAGAAPYMTLDMGSVYNDIDAELGIEAPAGALILPMEMLMSMAGGM